MAGVSGLKNGSVALTFHVPYEQSQDAFALHELQGKTVDLHVIEGS